MENSQNRRILRGALAMAASSLCFVLMDAIMREMARTHGLGMVIWARYLAQVVLVGGLLAVMYARSGHAGSLALLATRRPLLHLARGALLVLTTIFLTLALIALPFATTYAITLTNPILATLMALVVLGERPRPAMVACILLGFLGVLVILDPGGGMRSPAVFWALAMAVANAALHVLTRFLGRDEHPMALLTHIGIAALALSSLGLPWFLAPLPVSAWIWFALVGFFGVFAHLGMIEAYRHAPTALVAPLVYLQLVWSAVLGFVLFGEVPALRTSLGALLITLAGVLLVRAGMEKPRPPQPS